VVAAMNGSGARPAFGLLDALVLISGLIISFGGVTTTGAEPVADGGYTAGRMPTAATQPGGCCERARLPRRHRRAARCPHGQLHAAHTGKGCYGAPDWPVAGWRVRDM